jgi:hypothetical protein
VNEVIRGKFYRNLGDVEDRPFFNELCSNFVGVGFHGVSGYEFKSDVDMSGYVPLAKRVRGACRCSVCLSNLEIAEFYMNDVVCSDGLLCDRLSVDLKHSVCFWKQRGRIRFCLRFRGIRKL